MDTVDPGGDSPYNGLMPYREKDARYFCGRDNETSLVCANLIASRLTIFYGPSGVGKSSVLQAGAAYHVNHVLVRKSVEDVGYPEFAMAVFRSWRDGPAEGMLAAARSAAERVAGRELIVPELPPSPSRLAHGLEAVASAFGGTILLVLDQFEEYFNYHDGTDRQSGFSDELVFLFQHLRVRRGARSRGLDRPEEPESAGLRVHVMISIRDDALSKLDRFQGEIPDLFAWPLRIDPLDRGQATLAIEGPLHLYNVEHGIMTDPYGVEPRLVTQVLDGVRSGRIDLGVAGLGRTTVAEEAGKAGKSGAQQIEAAYLQLVMDRLWKEERRLGSRVLREDTFRKLDGALGIVRSHLDSVLGVLNPFDRRLVADLLRYLVTPSGSKIAQNVETLAEWTGAPRERVVEVLGKLASHKSRVLRDVGKPGELPGYEIYHDVLAKVVPEYVRAREAERAAERAGKLTLVALLLFVLLGLAVREWWIAESEKRVAEQQSRLATSRMLSGNALAMKDNALDLSLLLSLAAERQVYTPDARNSLSIGLGTNPSLVTFLRGNTGPVRSVAVVPGAPRIASCGEDGFVRFWDSDTHSPLGKFQVGGTPRRVLSIAFSRDGTRLASGDENGEIFLYDLNAWPPKPLLLAHVREVRNLAFSPDDRTLASACGDGKVFLWDVGPGGPSGRPLEGQRSRVHSVSFSPDGKTLASGGEGGLLLWDVPSGRPLNTIFHPHEASDRNGKPYVGAVAFSPDGRHLVTGGANFQLVLWTLSKRGEADDNPREPTDVQDWYQTKTILGGHEDSILCVAFSADGKTLASSGWDNVIKIWDVAKARPFGDPLRQHRGYVSGLAFLPDGKTLASSSQDASVIVWNLKPRHRLSTVLKEGVAETEGDPRPPEKEAKPDREQEAEKDLLCVAVRGDGMVTAAGDASGGLFLWDKRNPSTSSPLSLPGHKGAVSGVAFSPDGDVLASGGKGGVVLLWDLKTNPPHRRTLEGPRGDVSSVAFRPHDGGTLAVGGADWQVVLWDLATSPPRWRLIDGVGLNGHKPGEDDSKANENFVKSVAFHPNGRLLATGGMDFRVNLWDLSQHEPKPEALPGVNRGGGQSGWVQSVAFSPDGRTLAAGSWYDGVTLWDVATRRLLPRLIGPKTNVRRVAFSPDGKWIASGGDGMTILLWDLEWQRCAAELRARGRGSVRGLAFAPDSRSLVSGAEGGGVTLWDIDFQSWTRRACAVANRDLTLPEWESYLGSQQPYRLTCPHLPNPDGLLRPGR